MASFCAGSAAAADMVNKRIGLRRRIQVSGQSIANAMVGAARGMRGKSAGGEPRTQGSV